MATYVKVAGTWRTVTTDSPSNGVCGYVKVNGTWRTVNQSYVRINGTWRSVCTAPGQQPAPVQQTLCYRPTYCLNGTGGVILPTTENCYLADGSIGTRTAPYTCVTDPGCVTFTVPAGVCTKIEPIISVTSEEVGDCEYWGGLSGCTNGYGKRVTKKYSDGSLKVSYNCCDPLTGNVKYYCTLRPYSTGTCLNELKNEDITGTVIAGSGEWVCEAAGITTFPSCRTTENCTNPKSTSSYYEGCGYLSTGQRLVTINTYQSWCDTTQNTVIGDCLGETPKCGGAYCGEGSGEEEYANASCQSGTGIRYKCVTPEGCDTVYQFKRCTTYTPPTGPTGGGPTPTIYRVTEVCGTGGAATCRQYSTYTPTDPTDLSCVNRVRTDGQFEPCPATEVIQVVTGCPILREIPNQPCTTSSGSAGFQTIYRTPENCPDQYGACVAVTTGATCCQPDDGGYCANVGADGYGTFYQYYWDPCGLTSCSPVSLGRTFCGVPAATGPTAPPPDCTACTFGSGVTSCYGTYGPGTQTYCITDYGCPDRYGPCSSDSAGTTPATTGPTGTNPTGPTYTTIPSQATTTPLGGGSTEVITSTPTTDGGTVISIPGSDPIYIPDLSGLNFGGGGLKSINVNTLVRTPNGLVAAHDLKVGDKLWAAHIDGFPNESLSNIDLESIDWTTDNPTITLVETEIVNIRTRIAKWAVVVDGDIFSDTHYILVKRNEESKFVKALDLEPTDLVWSYVERNWLDIVALNKVDINHEVVSIDCEPYDVFFTERMLTHDSNTVD